MYLANHLREFHQNYSLGAVGNKDELSRFWGQRSKVKVMWLGSKGGCGSCVGGM